MTSVYHMVLGLVVCFFDDTATPDIYTDGHTLSLHDALPICLEGAVLGDMIATRALHLGCRGVLADGAVRDLDDLADVGLPVMARGIAPMAAHATLVPLDRKSTRLNSSH